MSDHRSAGRNKRHGGVDQLPSSSSSSSSGGSRSGSNIPNKRETVITTGRKFAPLPHHRRPIRAFHSAEETASGATVLPEVHVHGQNRNTDVKIRRKSFSANNLDDEKQKGQKVQGGDELQEDPNANPNPKVNNEDSCSVTVPTSTVSNQDSESQENICRICHDAPSADKLIKPCLCKGSMGTVHRSCLEHWLGESGKSSCEICGQEFNTVRMPRYTGLRSIFAWIRKPLNPTDSRNFFFDLACFFILTPLAALSGWLCVVGAQAYVNEGNRLANHISRRLHHPQYQRDVSNATWTSIGLLSLTATLVAAYLIWIFVAFRYHLQVWREWNQRNYIVSIVPLANGQYCFPPSESHLSPEPSAAQQAEQREIREQQFLMDRNLRRGILPRGGGGGRGRRHHEELNNNNPNDNEDDGSPTTRFINTMVIPALMLEQEQMEYEQALLTAEEEEPEGHEQEGKGTANADKTLTINGNNGNNDEEEGDNGNECPLEEVQVVPSPKTSDTIIVNLSTP